MESDQNGHIFANSNLKYITTIKMLQYDSNFIEIPSCGVAMALVWLGDKLFVNQFWQSPRRVMGSLGHNAIANYFHDIDYNKITFYIVYIDVYSIASTFAMQMLQSCAKPSIYFRV